MKKNIDTANFLSRSISFINNFFKKKIHHPPSKFVNDQAMMTAIVENSDDAILTESLNRIIQSWNLGAQKIFGYTKQEAIGRSISLIIPSDEMDGDKEIMLRLTHGERVKHFQSKRMTKDQHLIDVSISASPLIDNEGRIIGVSKILRDISELKRAEEAIKESENRFRVMANSAPVLIWLSGTDKLCTWFNQVWIDYTGRSMDQEIGNGWTEGVHPDDFNCCLETYVAAFDRRKPFSMEYRLRKADGQYGWLLDNGVPVYDGQMFKGYIGSCVDISERIKMEENLKISNEELLVVKEAAEAANLAKSAFLSNMSHEIRTPLGAMMGFAELIIDPQVRPSEKANFVAAIIRNGELLSNIINDILDLSKIEAGKMKIVAHEVALTEILTDTKTLLDLQAKEKGITLNIMLDENLPEIIRTDALRLRQILINIIGNAVKFTSKGAVDVRIKRVPPENEHDLLAFVVKDTGCGISDDQAAKLFAPFSQADATSKRKYGGTGLGLVLSKRFANLLGGDVVLTQSTPDKGSTFTITIDPGPIQYIQPEAIRETTPIPFQGEQPRLDGIKVLLADDSTDNQLVISRFLKLAGATVEVASNGKEAIEKAKKDQYHVLLMDLQMPIMDGFEATAELRKQGYLGKIVALTAHTLNDDRERCLRNGFNEHIGKPVNRNVLIEIVDHLSKREKLP